MKRPIEVLKKKSEWKWKLRDFFFRFILKIKYLVSRKKIYDILLTDKDTDYSLLGLIDYKLPIL